MKILIASCLLFAASAVHADGAAETRDAAPRTGAFEQSHTPAELLGEDSARHIAKIVAPDEVVSYEFYVPPGYRPDAPAGVLVYISPTYSGEMPESWSSVMDERNLIWVGANDSGNRQVVAKRAIFALLAPSAAATHYEIDYARVYVSGFSGGGKTASRVATDYAKLFKGALYFGGADFWDVDEPRYIEEIRANRFVFVTGTYDQALEPMEDVYERYKEAGVRNVKFMNIRDMTHRTPMRLDFAAALQYLDGRADPAPNGSAATPSSGADPE